MSNRRSAGTGRRLTAPGGSGYRPFRVVRCGTEPPRGSIPFESPFVTTQKTVLPRTGKEPFAFMKTKLFWVAVLYFSEGFPLGVFYDLFPVYFRQQGIALWKIGFMSLLGLAWTLKFLWAPAIDHYRRWRR